MRDARNATYRHSRTAPRINNADVPVVGRGREGGVRAAKDEKGDEGEEVEVEEEDENEEAEEEAGEEK